MSYITYDYYVSVYGSELVSSEEFKSLNWQAERQVDKHTTGIDGIKKLRVAFPADEYDAECVKQCVAQLIQFAAQTTATIKRAMSAQELTQTANGLQSKVISSISSGNESISYATNVQSATLVDKAAGDRAVYNKAVAGIITECLSGIKDANGVNLLYMGKYPFVIRGGSDV